ncbi:MAG: hypothetical protein AAGJ46_09820 [Planctomycetota bacterium]
MSTVGSLAVNVVARTDKFVAGITKARTTLGKLSTKLSAASRLAAGFSGAAALAGGTVATALVKNQFSAVDAIAKTSERLSIATEKLSAYQLAAGETGVSNETLANGLEKMAIRISDAAQGSGEAVDALAALGLNAQALNKLSPDQQFESIAAAMTKVGQQSDRVRLVSEIFGRSNTGLVNTLKLGAKGLREVESFASKAGHTVTEDMANAITQANDAFKRMVDLAGGLARQLAVRVAPMVEGVARRVTEFFTKNNRVHTFADAVARGAARIVAGVIDAAHEARVAFAEVKLMVAETADAIERFRKVTGLAARLATPGGAASAAARLAGGERPFGGGASSRAAEKLRGQLEALRNQDPAGLFMKAANHHLNRALAPTKQPDRQLSRNSERQVKLSESIDQTLRKMHDRMGRDTLPAANFAG